MLQGPRGISGFSYTEPEIGEIWVCNKLTVLQWLWLCTSSVWCWKQSKLMLELAFKGWEPGWLLAGFDLFKIPALTEKGLSVLLVYKKKHTVPLKPEHLERIVQRLHAQTDTQPCWQKLHFCNHFMHRTAFGFSGWAAPLWWAWTAGWYQQTRLSKYSRPPSITKQVTEQIKSLFIHN